MVKFLCCGLDSKGNTLISKVKEQLDRKVKINRKMKNALEKYAKLKPMNVFIPGKLYMPSQGEISYDVVDIAERARKVLKKLGCQK